MVLRANKQKSAFFDIRLNTTLLIERIRHIINDNQLAFITSAITGFLVFLLGKNWQKKLIDWIKLKTINFALSIGANWKKTWIVRLFNLVFYPLRTAIISKSTSIMYYYNVDGVRIYFFCNGITNTTFEWWGSDRMANFLDITKKEILVNKGEPIPMSAMASFFKELKEKNFIHVPCIDEATENQRFIIDVMEAEGVKSSYMELFFNENGKPIIVAVMNSKENCVVITDFTHFRSTFREIAIEFGQIKPRK